MNPSLLPPPSSLLPPPSSLLPPPSSLLPPPSSLLPPPSSLLPPPSSLLPPPPSLLPSRSLPPFLRPFIPLSLVDVWISREPAERYFNISSLRMFVPKLVVSFHVIAFGSYLRRFLSSCLGKNDGSVRGVRYFACKPRFGSFIRPEKAFPVHRGNSSPSTRNKSDSPRSAKRAESPSRNPVVLRAQAQDNRRKNEWKRRSNILFWIALMNKVRCERLIIDRWRSHGVMASAEEMLHAPSSLTMPAPVVAFSSKKGKRRRLGPYYGFWFLQKRL